MVDEAVVVAPESVPEILMLKQEVQDELILMSGGLQPSLDVTSITDNSSSCPTKLSTEQGLETDWGGECVYAHPSRHEIDNVLEHYWECKAAAPHNTSGIFVLPSKACPALIKSGKLSGMELLKLYAGGDRVLRPTELRSNPATAIQVWYNPPDVNVPVVTARPWRDAITGGCSAFRAARPQPPKPGSEPKSALESLAEYGPAYPQGSRHRPQVVGRSGHWEKNNGHWWRVAKDEPTIYTIQMIARPTTTGIRC